MRRLYRINSAPDFSGLDEPILLIGSTPLSLKNLIALGLAVAVAGIGFSIGGPVIINKLVPITLGGLLGISAGLTIILWSNLSRPDRSGLPIFILLLSNMLSSGDLTQKRSKPDRQPPLITIQADEDTGLARIELEGYAFDPATGRPLEKVDVAVDGKVYSIETRGGKYYLELELQRGVREIQVRLYGTQIVLRRYYVRIL